MAKNEVVIRFLGDASHFQKTSGIVGQESEKIGGKFSKLGGIVKVAGIGLATGALAALPGLVKTGDALESMAAKAETVFGGALGGVESWAKTNSNAMGLTRREATGLAADFADLLVPMGFTQKAAADMSTKVVGLSGALSAWSNGKRTAAEVSTILSKAMLGERDGLKELGISISEADVQNRLAANGQKELTGAALEQAKAVATSQLIFEKSTDAQKAFADSTETNTERALEAKGKMNELKDALAVGLVPVMAKATEIGLGVVNFLTNLSPTGQAAIGVIVGLAATAFVVVKAVQAWTAVQAALNVVMSMNPIGLVVIAVAALAAGLVIAYKKSETFRNIVDGAFSVVKAAAGGVASAIGKIVSAIKTAIEWVGKLISKLSSIPGGGIAKTILHAANIPGFAKGGVVPGRIGSPQLVVAHGGETVVPPGESVASVTGGSIPFTGRGMTGFAGGMTVNNYYATVQTGQMLNTVREVEDAVRRIMESLLGRGGAIGNGRGQYLQLA